MTGTNEVITYPVFSYVQCLTRLSGLTVFVLGNLAGIRWSRQKPEHLQSLQRGKQNSENPKTSKHRHHKCQNWAIYFEKELETMILKRKSTFFESADNSLEELIPMLET